MRSMVWFLFFGFCLAALGGEYENVVFGVRRVEKGVELVYGMARWPQDHDGFVVKRRPLDGNREWTQVHRAPLRPKAVAQIDWTSLGLSAEERQRLSEWTEGLDRHDRFAVKPLFGQKQLAVVAGTEAGHDIMRAAYEMFCESARFDYALLYGIACVDPAAAPDMEYVYGLFPVVDGEVLDVPVATRALDDKRTVPVDKLQIDVLTKHVGGDGFLLVWAIPRDQSESFGVRRCRVFRANRRDQVPSYRHLGVATGELETLDGKSRLQFSFVDRPEDSRFSEDGLYLYKLIPVNVFGQELNRTETIRQPAGVHVDDPSFKVVLPVMKEVAFDEASDQTTVVWEHKQEKKYVAGYRLERSIRGDSRGYQPLTKEWLSNDSRRYVDYGPFTNNTGYDYKVVARLQDGRRLPTQRSHGFICRKVPQVGSISVRRIVKDGKVYARVAWAAPDESAKRWIRGYVLGSAKGDETFAYFASLPLIRGRSFDYRLRGKGEDEYRFGVAAKSVWGEIGEFSKTELKLRGELAATPTRPKFVDPSPNNAYVTMAWEYPGEEALQGYRVYGFRMRPNRTEPILLFDETQVLAADPSVRLGPIEPHATYVYYVKAVDPDGIVSRKSFDASYRYTHSVSGRIDWRNPIVEIVDELSDLDAEFHEDVNGPDWISVSWDVGADYRDLVGSFVVAAEPADAVAAPLPLQVTGQKIRLPVKEGYSGELTAKIQVRHFQGKLYDPVTATVLVPPRQVTPDYFPRRTVIIYCAVASGLVFVVLCVGLYRRLRLHSDKKEAA